HPAHQPDTENQNRRVNMLRHHVGIDENARSHNPAHHNHGGVKHTQTAAGLRHATEHTRAPGLNWLQVATQTGFQTTPLLEPHAGGTAMRILVAISVCHLLNDMMQSVVPAIYPILKSSYNLSFTEIGLITLTFQLTASILQPLVGMYTDARPTPYSLAVG